MRGEKQSSDKEVTNCLARRAPPAALRDVLGTKLAATTARRRPDATRPGDGSAALAAAVDRDLRGSANTTRRLDLMTGEFIDGLPEPGPEGGALGRLGFT